MAADGDGFGWPRLHITFILSIEMSMGRIIIKRLILLIKSETGAGEGNRTLVSALGRPHSTIEPHPLPAAINS